MTAPRYCWSVPSIGPPANLGRDGDAWRALFEPFADAWPRLRHDVLAPLGVPRHPLLLAKFGMAAVRPARRLAETRFRGDRARALFAGIAAHSTLPLEAPLSAAVGLVLGVCAHTAGWPFPRGGAQRISDALAGCLRSLGGEIRTASPVTSLPDAPVVMCDVTPRQMLELAGTVFRRRFGRHSGAIATVPARSKWTGRWMAPSRGVPPNALAPAPCTSAARSTRSPNGKRATPAVRLSSSCSTPFSTPPALPRESIPPGPTATCRTASAADMTDAIEAQVERFAPGFRQRILGRHVFSPAAMESHNPNLVGGDFNGGALDIRQFFLRPTRRLYRTPLPGVYFCGSSTPPGGGVHGMCGFHAASKVLETSIKVDQ